MVKLYIKYEKLYLERAGKETQLESATIHHHRSEQLYKIIAFPAKISAKTLIYKQKTFPIPGINLEKIRDGSLRDDYKIFLTKRGKYYFINYYVI